MWSMYGERGTGLSKGRNIHKLGMELAMAAIVSALAGLFLFTCLNALGYRMLDKMLFRKDVIMAKEKECIDSLQAYIRENNLSSGDAGMLDAWTGKQKNILLTLYRGDKILYSNDGAEAVPAPYLEEGEGDSGPAGTSGPAETSGTTPAAGPAGTSGTTAAAGQENSPSQEPEDGSVIPWAYKLQFTDGPVDAFVSYFFESVYYMAVSAVNGVLSVIVFMIFLFLLIRRKVRYIALLEQEIQILKGGDLDYRITVRGKDELASLAGEIDAMRCAVRERQEQEEEARNANRDLVTAMSHDLRTPLTSLLGYVDILQMDRYRDEEQYRRCLGAVRDKAYQIKEMSDKMFEYFIVYGKGQEELETTQVNGAEFLGQVVEESLFDMENEGFTIERSSDDIDCRLLVDIALVRRVFGNIFSNLLKYADSSRPVTVEYRQGKDRLSIRFVNYVSQDFKEKESSSIGLKTCGKIMGDHKGCFTCERKGNMFVAELEFPTLEPMP